MKSLMRKRMSLAAGAALAVGAMVPTQSAFALFGYTSGFEPGTDGDTYQPADANPFDETGSRGVTAGGNQGEGTIWDVQYWADIRNNTGGNFREGFAEEVLSGHHGITSSSGAGHLVIYPNPANPDGPTAYPAGWDASTRAGGAETTRKLDTAGAYSSSFDVYLNPNWIGGVGAPTIWYDPQVSDSTGGYVTEGTAQITKLDADSWRFSGGSGSFDFDDADGGWYKVEVVVEVRPDGSDTGTETDIWFTSKLWSPDLTQLYGSVDSIDYLVALSGIGADGDLAYGNRSENFIYSSNAIRNAGLGNNFFAIDNFREGSPLIQAVVPEPASLALLAGGGLMMLRRRRA